MIPIAALNKASLGSPNGSNLYVAKNRYTAFDSSDKTENTRIYRFSLANGEFTRNAYGEVKGHPVDNHSIDENNGYVRVVTSNVEDKDKKIVNSVYVLNNKYGYKYCSKNVSGGNVTGREFHAIYSFPLPSGEELSHQN